MDIKLLLISIIIIATVIIVISFLILRKKGEKPKVRRVTEYELPESGPKYLFIPKND